MSSLLGGNSKGKTSSSSQTGIYNQNNPALVSDLGSTAASLGGTNSLIQQLLTGTGGDSAFHNYQNSTGYQSQLEQGTKAITNNAATAGLLNSGATLKGVQTYGQNLDAQSFNQYLSNLFNLGTQGTSAASTLASSGGVTNTSSTSNGTTKSKTGLGF